MYIYNIYIYTHVSEYRHLSDYWSTELAWLLLWFGLPGYWNVCILMRCYIPHAWFVLWNLRDLCWLSMIHSHRNRNESAYIGILTQVDYELLLSCPNFGTYKFVVTGLLQPPSSIRFFVEVPDLCRPSKERHEALLSCSWTGSCAGEESWR